MMCGPIIAIAEIVSGGALSGALGSALGSQVLGSAVLGLVASEGDPMGAVLGGLGGAVAGSMSGASGMTDAAGAVVESTTGQLAAETIGTNISASADEFAYMNGLEEAAGAAAAGPLGEAGNALSTDAFTSAAMSGSVDPSVGPLDPGYAARQAQGGVSKARQLTEGPSTLDKIEGFAKKNPNITKTGLGMVKGLGDHLAQKGQLKDKYKMQSDLEEERRRRAFGGLSYLTPFRPNPSYQRPAGPLGGM